MNISQVDHSWPSEMRPEKFELNSIRRGHFVRLKTDGGTMFWCMVCEVQRSNGTFVGRAEDTFTDGPKKGDMIVFDRSHIHEVV